MEKVLYRAYRPLCFADVKGQQHITKTLQNALKKSAIAQAYLFTGPHGVGKTSVARILAHQINQIDYTPESQNIDIIEIDAASNRRIDEMRELREKAQVAPAHSKYKVYIIDEVHMLTREAFNALLKTLEEPPKHVIFILATTEVHKVPNTIISRTQRFSFKPQDSKTLQDQLRHIANQEKIPINDQALELLVSHGNSSFRDSIGLLDQVRHITPADNTTITAQDVSEVLGLPPQALLEDLADSLVNNDPDLLFQSTAKLIQQGISASIVSQDLLNTLRTKLINREIPPRQTIQTMRLLLENINNATYDQIEVALLSNIQLENSDNSTPIKTPKPTPKPPKPSQTEKKSESSKEQVAQTTEDEQPKEEPEPPTNQSDDQPKSKQKFDWEEILQTIRQKHNALYGILKMAEVQKENQQLTLKFKFPFHQKQLLQQRNLRILQQTLEAHHSEKLQIQTELAPANSTQPTKDSQPTTESNQPKNNLENISNIFSGAELIE